MRGLTGGSSSGLIVLAMVRIGTVIVVFLVLAVAIVALRPGAATVAMPPAIAPKGSTSALTRALDVRHPRRVAILVLENHGYGQVIGSPQAPYLTRLAHRSTLFTDYRAIT